MLLLSNHIYQLFVARTVVTVQEASPSLAQIGKSKLFAWAYFSTILVPYQGLNGEKSSFNKFSIGKNNGVGISFQANHCQTSQRSGSIISGSPDFE